MPIVRTIVPVLLVFAALGTTIGRARAQSLSQATDFAVSVEDPRPLSAAIREIESRFGIPITYEDPLNANAADAVDLLGGNRRERGLPPTRIPRGGPLFFTYGQQSAQSEDKMDVLLKALEAYDASGYPGKFEIRRSGGILHVVPTSTADSQGRTVKYVSMLDLSVSLSAGRRNVIELLQELVDSLSTQVGIKVFLGTVPLNLFLNTHVETEGGAESARAALLRVVDATKNKLSWQLFCTPGQPTCALNVHGVENPAQKQ